MKKILVVILLLLTLCACNKADNSDMSKYEAYLSYYDTILDTKEKLESSENYDFSLVVNKIDDNNYRYDLIIDNPRIAMYEIKALAIIDGIYSDASKQEMMPSIGIFDDDKVALVPGQIDNQNKFYKGISLSLIFNKPSLKVSAMVSWKNNNDNKVVKEFITTYSEFVEDYE